VSSLTFLSLRPILRLLTRGTRSDRHRVLPCDLPAGQTMSTPLDRGSIVPLCAVCIEAGRATEATHQTRDLLCGCDQHIQLLERHGRAAVRLARRSAAFWSVWWPSIDAAPAGRALPMPPRREGSGDPGPADRPPHPLTDDRRRRGNAPPPPGTRRRRSAGDRRSGRVRSGDS
jgi:hypothetical protein